MATDVRDDPDGGPADADGSWGMDSPTAYKAVAIFLGTTWTLWLAVVWLAILSGRMVLPYEFH